MKWTNEPPKADGYYWIRYENGGKQTQIVEVSQDHVFMTAPENGDECCLIKGIINNDTYRNLEWFGPIEEPE